MTRETKPERKQGCLENLHDSGPNVFWNVFEHGQQG